MLHKKGAMDLKDIAPAGIALAVTAITLGLGGSIIDDVATGQVINSTARNSSIYANQGLVKLSGWLPTTAVVIAAAIVLGVIIYSFMKNRD